MKVENGKITEATEDELFERWLETEYYDFYDFETYLCKMQKAGVRVVDETEGRQNEA